MTQLQIKAGPPIDQLDFAFDGSIAVSVGDLMFHDTNDVKPMSSMTDQGSEALNQALAAPLFAGLAGDARGTADTTAVTSFRVMTDAIVEIDCTSNTFEVGDMVTFCNNGGGTALENQKVKKTTDNTLAIGRLVKRYASAATRILVRLSSRVSGTLNTVTAATLSNPLAITSASAVSFAVGRQGTTNPSLNVDSSAATAITGLNIVAAASGSGIAVAATGGTNEAITIDGKGTGGVKINSVGGTGAIRLGGAASGNNATGLTVTPNAAASGLAIAVVSTGTNENLTIDAKGSGTITLGGTSTGNIVATRAIAGALGITSSGSTAGIGYATGAGGTVIQITNRSTGVTLNKICGTVQTDTTSLAAGAEAAFTVTNSAVAIGDTVIVSLRSGNSGVGTCLPWVSAVAAGSFDITITNTHASTAETGACVINFAVIKAVTA